MAIVCTSNPCPIILNATCVFYEGANLIYTGIHTNDSIQLALEKIDAKMYTNSLVIPTLQAVSDVGHTIFVPNSRVSGISIEIDNLAYQNAFRAVAPLRTNIGASDLFLAELNGQDPISIPGFIGGFVADIHGDNNIGHVSVLNTDAIDSQGFYSVSHDAHTGSHFLAGRIVSDIYNTVFEVFNNGSVLALSYAVPGGTSLDFLKADGSLDSTVYEPLIGYVPANDADVVKLTGNQSIEGEKTFLNSILVKDVDIDPKTTITAEGIVYTETGKTNSIRLGASLEPAGSNNYVQILPNASGTIALVGDIPPTPNLQQVTDSGNVTTNSIIANSFVIPGGTSVQFLKADGSLDNDTYAHLVGGKVPASELPSYVDDVIEVATYSALPVTGEIGKLYVTLDTNLVYRWTGSTYVEISPTIFFSLQDVTDVGNTTTQIITASGFVKAGATSSNLLLAGGGDISQSTFQPALGYIPEDEANKSDSYLVSSSITYASTKALVDGLELKVDKSNTEGARLDPTFTDIYGWGDSLTNGGAETPYTTYLNQLTNFTITNRGVGGETSTQIKDRFIAEPSAYSKSVIIWSGRNNLLDPTTVKADIATMIAALGHTRYLVVSILNGVDEPVGNSIYNAIISLNNDLSTIYGDKFVDVRTYLVNLLPNPQDVIDASLRSDNLHLNSLGYQRTAEYFNSKLGILFNQTQYLQSKDFNYYLKSNNTIDGTGTTNQLAYFTDSNTITGATAVIYDNATYSLGVGTLPISSGDGSSWLATGAPFANAFGGGLISSIAGINGAYFYSSQNYAIVRAGINYLSSPMGVKLQVNDVDDALIVESDKSIVLPILAGNTNKLIKTDVNGKLQTTTIIDDGTNVSITGNITTDSFIKSGGLSTEFLKADGSVDTNAYATQAELALKENATSTAVTSVVTLVNNGTTFTLSAFTGVIVNNSTVPATRTIINFTGAVNVTPLFQLSLLYVDNTGTLQQANGATEDLPQLQKVNNIYIGRVVFNSGFILALNLNPSIEYGIHNRFRNLGDKIRNINEGNNIGANGVNLQVNKGAGTTWRIGSNFSNDRKVPDETIDIAAIPIPAGVNAIGYRNGSGGWTYESFTGSITPTFWDNGTGTKGIVSNNKYTNVRVYFFNATDTYIFYLGRTEHSTLQAAVLDAEKPNAIVDPATSVASLIGTISVEKGCTDLTNTALAAFTQGPRMQGGASSGGTSGSQNLQAVYSNSLQPQIITNSTLGAVDFQRGSAADTDHVFRIKNGAGTVTANINGLGEFTSTKYIITGGLSTQFLKADGSIDSNSYALATGGAGYIQNQNISAQSANMWISGTGRFGSDVKVERLLLNGHSINDTILYSEVGTDDFVLDNLGVKFRIKQGTGEATFASSVTATSFIKSGATAGNILLAGGNDIPQSTFQTALTNPVTGTGVAGQVPFWTGTNSQVGDNGLTWNNTSKTLLITSDNTQLSLKTATTPDKQILIGYEVTGDYGYIQVLHQLVAYKNLVLNKDGGNVLIGTSSDTGYKLQVNGSGYFTSNVISDIGFKRPTFGDMFNLADKWIFGAGNGSRYYFYNNTVGIEQLRLFENTGNSSFGGADDNGYKLEVNGTLKATSYTGSATLTGTPIAPTATVGTNTTQIATTEFVQTADAGNVKLTGNQTIAGTKTFSKTGASTSIVSTLSAASTGSGIYSENSSTTAIGINSRNLSTGIGIRTVNESTGDGLFSNNISTGRGIRSDNTSSGDGIYSSNISSGRGIYSSNSSSGNAIVSNGETGSSGYVYVGQNNGTTTFSASKEGNLTANSFIKSGGTSDQFLKADGSTSIGYKVYTALLSQTGTGAPSATVLENTLGGTLVWTRNTTGIYEGTLSSTFTDLKTVCFVSFGGNGGTAYTGDHTFQINRNGANIVEIRHTRNDTAADDFKASVEIRVYP